MKKRIPTFLSGMLTMALIGGLGVTALAATGQMTITVDPVNIQVNGQTFQPKDANGADVPVFAYNGTTYAPLRALAEAYGLTVGYDQEANMATVGDPAPDTTAATYSDWTDEEEAAYLEFKGMWNIVIDEAEIQQGNNIIAAVYTLGTDYGVFLRYLENLGENKVHLFLSELTKEVAESNSEIRQISFQYLGSDVNDNRLFNVNADGNVIADFIFHDGLLEN